jgi:hypothetical protein
MPSSGWLLRLVIAFGFAQAAVSMARPAVSYRALALGADERAIGVIAGVYALLPLFAAVPLGRRTDHGRCAPLLPIGVVLISGGCALSGTAVSLLAMAVTGNRLGQVAAPASAGLVAGVAGTAAPFAMLGVLLLAAAGLATRQPGRRDHPGVDGPRAGGLPRPPGADGSVQKAQPQPARESFPDRE